MPTWGEILKELVDFQTKEKKPPFDFVRRKYLKRLQQYTKRNTILYAVNWTQLKSIPSELISIVDEDIQGFMEVISGLSGDELDIVIHSPDDTAEATEALVIYLRSKFNHIRAIIPHGAMSAATMLACAANEIIMGKHSFIGPIDPQVIVHTRLGLQSIPAQAIVEQFNRARKECMDDPKNLGVWLPIVEQYGPALIVQCEHANELSKLLVTEWLQKYMFAGKKEASEISKEIGNKLSEHVVFKSHARHIGREQAKNLKLKIQDLEEDQNLQDLTLSVYHATTHTFDATPAVKIIENHIGKAFIKRSQQLTIPVPAPQTPIPPRKDK
jgi:hypothetical protein